MSIMEEYIKLTKKHITDYIRLVLDNKFVRKYSDEFLDAYTKTRYYDAEENKTKLKVQILKSLDDKKKELIEIYPEKEKNIENMALFYRYVLYFDNVIRTNEIEKIIDVISEKRKKIKEDESFKQKLSALIEKNNLEIDNLLNSVKSEEFRVELKKIEQKKNIYETKLTYNIKFPVLYSKYAIQKAFDTGNILEDKLFVEYHLIVGQILSDLKYNIKKQYIIEFAETLFKKKQKLKKLMDIIKNPTIQERVSLKINNTGFEKYKDNIYDLMRMGVKFSIILDDNFKFNKLEIEKFNIFKYVLVDKQIQSHKEIINNKTKIKNLIEI